MEINSFWEMFSFKECSYNVIFPIKRADIKKLLDHFQNITVTENAQKLFGDSCRWIVEMHKMQKKHGLKLHWKMV